MKKTAKVRARGEPELKNQVELCDELLCDVGVPTAATKRTFEASEAGRDLVTCKDADDMFRKLEARR